ncbi:MAG: RNA polymerase sigma factor [Acidimicrobiia bacterium]
MAGDVQLELAEVARVEGGRILAVLAGAVGDLQLAEDAVQDATVSALEVWPRTGVPANPAGWLYVAARRKVIDRTRREGGRAAREADAEAMREQLRPEPPSPDAIGDDVLRLLFTCCHPALALESQVALALRTLCGLPVADVARVLLTSEVAMEKRLVRIRQKIARAGIPYRVPSRDELPERLAGVCAVVHLVYTAGHHGHAEGVRVDLCQEALRLARLLVELLPDPTVEALLALLLLTEARRPARLDDDGELVPLARQDRLRWDRSAVDEGIHHLNRSLQATAGVADPYQLQAAIAAEHSRAPSHEATDWAEVVRLYDILRSVHPNPVVELNAAVASAEVHGPRAALAMLDGLSPEVGGHLRHLARGEMLTRLGLVDEALSALGEAFAAAPSDLERRAVRRRMDELTSDRRAEG